MSEETAGEGAIKVMVVDDHPIVREGIAGMLRDAGYHVCEAGNGQDAVDLASSVRPQLVIMDVLMPGMSGIEATERIVAQNPAVRILMLSVADAPETVRAAVKSGAASYLTKAAASRDSLLDALRRTADGDRVFAPADLVDALIQEPAQAPQSDAARLTLREREIVALAAQGATNAAIADALLLSPRTVENHLARIFRKFAITSRTQLARVATGQQIDRYPWAGQTCTIMFVDILAFSAPTRSDRDQMALRKAFFEIIHDAFTRSGLPRSTSVLEDRGDGVLIVAPPGVPTSALIDPWLAALTDGLRRHNSTAFESVTMQLRVALDVGPVWADDIGVSGEAILRAARLLDAPVFRERLRATGADVGVIVSDFIYRMMSGQGRHGLHPADAQRVDIRVKETEATAWMWFSGPHSSPTGFQSAAEAAHEDWAHAIPEPVRARLQAYLPVLQTLRENGVATVGFEGLATSAGVNPAKVRKDLSHLGTYGARGAGYDVEDLIGRLTEERAGDASPAVRRERLGEQTAARHSE